MRKKCLKFAQVLFELVKEFQREVKGMPGFKLAGGIVRGREQRLVGRLDGGFVQFSGRTLIEPVVGRGELVLQIFGGD